ncbi:MAG: hypothetical protein A2X49_15590 [Lentisphaerae bacterium GWF2_52_8]|nr:MAG: hypothetical protein A2X49_15590 [Lentisphaerae bacterium GWF2_52_8]
MSRKKRKFDVKDAEVPLSAMIDVVFLLLIYFIVSQKPIVEDTLLGMDLPAPGGKPKSDKPMTMLTIDVAKLAKNSDDVYHVNGQPFFFNDLKNFLKQTAENDKDTTIIVNCDPNAKHKKLIRLLDTCQEYGMTKLNLVNDESIKFVPDK